ncbi:MAG: hypothetical protein IAE78_17700 [Myxococcus sp.]|nr:hypothetical protein [Myxococcus sp.]
MPAPIDRAALKRLQQESPKLKELVEAGDWSTLRTKTAELKARATAQGIDSAYLAWCAAIAHHELGEPTEAVEAICHAARLDPVHPAITRAFRDVCRGARTRLCDEPTGSALVPALYAQLSRIGETDLACHLAMAHHQLEQGEVAAATTLVDAVVLVAPSNLEARALRRHLAQVTEDPNAARFEAMADDVEARQPFGVPGVRGRC